MVNRILAVLAVVTAVFVLLAGQASCEDASQAFQEAGITVPEDLNRSPELYTKLLTELKLDSAFDETSVPPGSAITSITGKLQGALYSHPDGRRFLVLANKDNAAEQKVTVTFGQDTTLFRMSRFTGLPRRKGCQAAWEMLFNPGEVRLYQWMPGKDEPKNTKPRVALNPSSQYANVITKDGVQIYNEGTNMWHYAVKIKEYLDRDGRVDSFITRRRQRQDMFLRWEMDIAKMAKADAVVALHSDATSSSDPKVNGGTWTFYKDEEGKRLATEVQMAVLEAIKTVYPEVSFKGIREHWYRLYVLHNSGCPAALTEVLFHTNPKEREMLKDPAFQDLVSRAFADGILKYFGYDGLKL